MKLTPWYLAALAPIAVAGCSGALMGHVAVLAVAIGIFVGTLSLGRQTPPRPAAALRPSSRSSRAGESRRTRFLARTRRRDTEDSVMSIRCLAVLSDRARRRWLALAACSSPGMSSRGGAPSERPAERGPIGAAAASSTGGFTSRGASAASPAPTHSSRSAPAAKSSTATSAPPAPPRSSPRPRRTRCRRLRRRRRSGRRPP